MFSLLPHRKAEPKVAREFDKPFGPMRSEMAELFGRLFGPFCGPEGGAPSGPQLMERPGDEVAMGLKVVEREKEIRVRVAVPGFEPEELAVEVTGNVLTIRGEPKETEENKETVERPYRRMVRSIVLPTGIETERVEAHCKNGLREVVLPWKPEAVTRRIEVKT